MKNKSLFIVGIVAVIIGFSLAWLIKPLQDQEMITSENKILENSEVSQNLIWTCSMHPQIRQNEPGQCPICAMDLIPLNESNSATVNLFEMTEEAVKLANIQTTTIGGTAAAGGNEIKLNGKIQADETQSASIVAHIPGRIEKLFISYTGEQVSKGQKIASIYSPDLITAQKELIEVQKITDVSPALLDASKNKLKFWKISDASIADILQSGKIQENFPIYADFPGIVIGKNVSVGDYINTGTVLFNIQNLNKLWVLFDVYESDLRRIKVGNKLEFRTPSLPGKTFNGKVNFIDPVINPETRTAKIRVEVNNYSQNLKPEMFVTGELFSISTKAGQIIVPKTAVMWTGERSVVYIKVPETNVPTYEFREITLGNATGLNYEVKNGLTVGEEVVTNGAFVIDASSQLNNQKSMMNRNVVTKMVMNDNPTVDSPENAEHENFTVYGNCEICKKTIEGSLKKVDGIFMADWNIENKKMDVSFNAEKISLDEIKQKIANVGYDTDTHRASNEVYKKLPKCCQFERPE